MVVTRLSRLGACLLPFLLAPAVQATTNTNFNFEADDGGWTVQTVGSVEQPWTYLDTGPDKGWQAFRGDDAAGSGSYLVSPLMVLDPPSGKPQQYVGVRIKHFYDFGPLADPWSLGQVQYRYAGGSWQGIRTADFEPASLEDYPPNSSGPPAPFFSMTDVPDPLTPVQAWAGATAGFPGTHRQSDFRLEYPPLGDYPFSPGGTFQIRLLAGTLDPLAAGSPALLWDVTAVQVFHAGIVPEPEIAALAGGGLLIGGLGFIRRSRRRLF
jgi:hypothetical protein